VQVNRAILHNSFPSGNGEKIKVIVYGSPVKAKERLFKKQQFGWHHGINSSLTMIVRGVCLLKAKTSKKLLPNMPIA